MKVDYLSEFGFRLSDYGKYGAIVLFLPPPGPPPLGAGPARRCGTRTGTGTAVRSGTRRAALRPGAVPGCRCRAPPPRPELGRARQVPPLAPRSFTFLSLAPRKSLRASLALRDPGRLRASRQPGGTRRGSSRGFCDDSALFAVSCVGCFLFHFFPLLSLGVWSVKVACQVPVLSK